MSVVEQTPDRVVMQVERGADRRQAHAEEPLSGMRTARGALRLMRRDIAISHGIRPELAACRSMYVVVASTSGEDTAAEAACDSVGRGRQELRRGKKEAGVAAMSARLRPPGRLSDRRAGSPHRAPTDRARRCAG
ncbi:hypothetical protein WI41_25950 [Burkholderia latens]|uniref:Uncharacterized protein n=1 Tax=Burkholderia latens TaxID=488446 RepID=A0AAP1C2T3_9BURK|nr:hypothetical protein WI41_25950 [Burkholderia latens]